MEYHLGAAKRRDLLKENLRQALAVIRAHRLRSFLLILGVAIGITTILCMVAVLSGLGRTINRDLVSASRPYLIVQRFDVIVGGIDEEEMRRRKRFEPEDAERLAQEAPSLDYVCYTISPEAPFILRRAGRKTQPLQVVGASHTLPYIYSLQLESGRFYNELDELHSKRVVVLGYGPARDLFPHENPIGKSIRIRNHRYKVIGTFAKRKHFMGSISDNFAVVPTRSFIKDFKRPFDDSSITANVKEGYTLEQGESEVVNAMRRIRGLRPGEKNNFVVITSEAFLEMVSKVTFYIGLVLLVIASIGLVVGGIGVMNIMLISVNERIREIGVRMAVGARRRDILQQVLVESAALTGIGGLVGTGLGFLAALAVARLIGFPFHFSVPWMVISIAFSAFVGLVFGIYPAQRASKLDPVTALRYE